MDVVEQAYAFAELAHRGQVRKYTGEPYINHPMEVAIMVRNAGGTQAMIAAALLHDVVEDTDKTMTDIHNEFGFEVMQMVNDLTDVSQPSDGNRAVRKEVDRLHIFAGSPESKTIKLADLISNSHSIVKHDPEFARTYIKEKQELLKVLKAGNPDLYAQATALVEEAVIQLGL